MCGDGCRSPAGAYLESVRQRLQRPRVRVGPDVPLRREPVAGAARHVANLVAARAAGLMRKSHQRRPEYGRSTSCKPRKSAARCVYRRLQTLDSAGAQRGQRQLPLRGSGRPRMRQRAHQQDARGWQPVAPDGHDLGHAARARQNAVTARRPYARQSLGQLADGGAVL